MGGENSEHIFNTPTVKLENLNRHRYIYIIPIHEPQIRAYIRATTILIKLKQMHKQIQ